MTILRRISLLPTLPVCSPSSTLLLSFALSRLLSGYFPAHTNTRAVLIFTAGFFSIVLFALKTTLWQMCFVTIALSTLYLVEPGAPSGCNQMPEHEFKMILQTDYLSYNSGSQLKWGIKVFLDKSCSYSGLSLLLLLLSLSLPPSPSFVSLIPSDCQLQWSRDQKTAFSGLHQIAE